MTDEDWTVRKAAGQLEPGERFIFAEDLGGEGEALTVVAVSADMFGTTEVEVEELDTTLDLGSKQMVIMAPDEGDDDEEEGVNWKRADRAATALQAYHDATQGRDPFMGESYGDEGSEEMAEAIVGLLTDLKHLTLRCGLMFPDLNDEATERWSQQLEEEEGE